jgi:serine/threonine protein kinase/tetratricopeptide (TPR) repeat protein
MTPERWQHVKAVFQAAAEHRPGERRAYLDQACAGDSDLRRQVEALLVSHEQAPSFLEAPVFELAALAASAGPSDSMVGRRIGPYQVVREIGRGGMGTVYLARRADDQYEKQVAIKVVKRGMDTDAVLRRFRTERQILAHLDHPNIATLLDAGMTDDGRSYVIMDYVDGVRLDVYCETRRLPIAERLTLFLSVCSAVQYAHEHHIVHRDIKPSNVLVTVEGVPKLLDFGIAKLFQTEESSQTLDRTTVALRPMTPEYASPEQVRGEPITPASDIYALGVLLYELLTGHRPYRLARRTPPEIERVICQEVPQKPSAVISQVDEIHRVDGQAPLWITPESVSTMRGSRPETLRRRLAGDLDTIVLMALRKEPARRYVSTAALADDIRRYLERLPIRARRDALAYRTSKFVRRNTAAVSAAGLAMALFMFIGLERYSPARRDATIDHAIPSIAVLPLVNLSGDASQEYFADGMTDAIISELSQIKALRVISRTSMMPFKNTRKPLPEIARELKADAVVEGSVRRDGAQVHVAVRIVHAATDRPLWSRSYDSDLSLVLELQRKVAGGIAQETPITLTSDDRKRLATARPVRPDAYEAHLRGRYFYNKRTEGGLKKAVEEFEQAVALDPTYAPAYAWLADAFEVSSNFSILPTSEACTKARAAALKALDLDSELAEPHTVLGLVNLYYDWDWPAAEGHFKRAIALEADDARSHHAFGVGLSKLARFDEATREIQRARELDPVNLEINASIPMVLYYARRYDQAISEARRTVELDPNHPLVHRIIGKACVQKGLYDQAIAAFRTGIASGGVQLLNAELGHVYAVSGQRAEAMKMLSELKDLSRHKYVAAFDIAVIHVGLGETDQAFQWLERSYAARERFLVNLMVEPVLDPLRSDPRFAELVRRVGLWRPPQRATSSGGGGRVPTLVEKGKWRNLLLTKADRR